MPTAYEDFVDFLVAEAAPEKIIAFAPSETSRARAYELLSREKSGTISADEKRELDQFVQLEHVFSVAKARAYEHLTATGNAVPK
ncbi:MAG: hypothetical protein H7Y38_03645 [Armatimonadetes bacterium]|nr:hypothetical protein [Armatimonadota bacterium]